MTVCIALSIRGSTDAWNQTVRLIETSPSRDFAPFHLFECYLKRHSYLDDLGEIIIFPRRKVLTSVTRMYTLLALCAFFAFIYLLLGQLGLLPWCYTH
jgi:hypothetical protein